jgi:DNA polymerase-1
MGRTILIDADILAYQISTSQEEVFEFGGRHVLHADLEAGCREVDNAVSWIIQNTDSDQAVLFVTGDTVDNFRLGVLPSYKGNRKGIRRPMILQGLKDYMKEAYKCFHEKILEADDLIGIHATMPHKGERVVYSADKDLKTIPGLHWDGDDGEVIEVTEAEADRFFYEQILTGDPVDNYTGCPGVGPAGAAELLDNNLMWHREVGEYKSGPRKGQEKITWKKVESGSPWMSIVSAYHKVGLREKDALQQARCARILRHGDYDFKQGKVKLWTPN